MNFTADLFDHHVATLGQLLDSAGALTGPQLDEPIELSVPGIDERPTIRSLLSRLVGQLDMWNAAMASQPYDFEIERGETIESMRARLDRVGPRFAAYVRDVSDGDKFDETFVDATGDEPYVFSAGGMIAHIITYAAYRRTLVASAIEAAGGSSLTDDPLYWFRP